MHIYNENVVSLVTPGWNGKLFVHRLLDSIIQQTYRPIEYIYVDDGSTDGTKNIVLSYAQKFKEADIDFKFIYQENGGICEALKTGIQAVTGKYLSCPEYDDILLPFSIEKKVNYLKEHVDCAVVTADAWVVTENDLEQRTSLISHHNPNRFARNHFYQALMSDSIFNAACQMIRMDLFDLTHPNRSFFSSRLAPNQQILLPLYYSYNRGFIEEPLSLYLKRPGSLSAPKKSFEKKIDDLFEYKEILFQTLESIKMPKSDLDLYKRRVNINVNKDLILYSYELLNVNLFKTAFSYLEEQNEIHPIYLKYNKRLSQKYILYLLKFKHFLLNLFNNEKKISYCCREFIWRRSRENLTNNL